MTMVTMPMRVQLLHLSGPYRGATITHTEPLVTMGTAPDSTIRFRRGGSVSKRHAEIRFVEPECNFYIKAIGGPVFVNAREIEEVILETEDLIEVGLNGPKMRFRICYETGAVCKPVRQMLSDAVEVGGVSGLKAEAKAAGKRSWVHSHSASAARDAVLAGCTTVAHGSQLGDREFALMAKHGTYFEPNIGLVSQNYLENRERYLGTGNYTDDGFRKTEEGIPLKLEMFRRAMVLRCARTMRSTMKAPMSEAALPSCSRSCRTAARMSSRLLSASYHSVTRA